MSSIANTYPVNFCRFGSFPDICFFKLGLLVRYFVEFREIALYNSLFLTLVNIMYL